MILTKEEALDAVEKDGMLLRLVLDEYSDDWDVVRTAITNNPHAFQFASQRLQNDKALSSLVVKDDAYYFNIVDERDGYRFEIPMLNSGSPGFYFKYINYMKIRERSPETFEKVLNWD